MGNASPVMGTNFLVRPQDLYRYDPNIDGVLPNLDPGVASVFGNILAFMTSHMSWCAFDAERLLAFTVLSGHNPSDYDASTLNQLLHILVKLDLLALVDDAGEDCFAITPEFVGLALLGKGVRKIVCGSKLLLPIPEHRRSQVLSAHACIVEHRCVMFTSRKA